jgi:predicted RNA binding protein YcfA (HicA-like mRNA interferase family)
MKHNELIRLLKQNGWVVVSQKGSHLKMRHPNHENTLIVPNHGAKDVKTGLIYAILKQGKIISR